MAMLRELFGIDFRAAVGSGRMLIGQMRAVALHLARVGIEQQRAHGGSADVEAYNEGIREHRSTCAR